MNASSPIQSVLRPGDKLGKYVIERCLGIGGMGEVYLVHHERLQMQFALKLVKPAILHADPIFCERFLREARLASGFQHPGSIEVCDAELDKASGILYLVMEFVDGQTVEQILTDGPLSELQALEIIRSVAETLDAASALGLVHRDIKPANIMISRSGQVKLADLGIAKSTNHEREITLTVDNLMIGTASYAAPEQLQDAHHVDTRADIYSLGATLYEMLTGSVPFDGETVFETMEHVLSDPIPDPRKINPRINQGTVALLNTMLAKRPDDRPANAAELIRQIDPLLAELKLRTPELQSLIRDRVEMEVSRQRTSLTTQQSVRQRPTRKKFGVLLGGLLAGMLVLLITGLLLGKRLGTMRQEFDAQAKLLESAQNTVRENQVKLSKVQNDLEQLRKRRTTAEEKINELKSKVVADLPTKMTTGDFLKLAAAQNDAGKKFVLRWKGKQEQIEKSIQVSLPGGERLELVWCPAGEFPMGTPFTERGRRADEKLHRVILTQPFWIGQYEVTQPQFIALMDRDPTSDDNVGRRNPVEVTWHDAVEFCRRLNEREMLAGRLPAGYVYALPTEAHWEFAARAGKPGSLGGAPDLASCAVIGASKFDRVGTKRPNSWAIYDMFGNAAEWVMDRYSDYPDTDLTDPVPRKQGENLRVVRGGSVVSPAADCRAGARRSLPPDQAKMTGFRIALIPEEMVKYDYK